MLSLLLSSFGFLNYKLFGNDKVHSMEKELLFHVNDFVQTAGQSWKRQSYI